VTAAALPAAAGVPMFRAMISSGRLLRFLRLCLAALQVAMPVAAGVADAILEAESAHAYAHLEPHSSKSCPPAHSEDSCTLCQFGHSHAAGARHTPPVLWQRDAGTAPAAIPAAPCPALTASSPLPRAPPALS
jgi:hypothetical protein